MKILVADDDLTSRSILGGILKKWGYEPVIAINGDEAWEVLQCHDAPRLAILDWNMPGMDGLEVCAKIRQMDTSDPPYIIILTGRGEKEDIVEGLEAGANDYISKPYDNQELRARIRVGQRMVDLQAELNEARDSLAYEARHDSLTGVLNRRAILDTLKKEISRATCESRGLSIGLCDIDHFKHVNDAHGHQVGDEVLCEFARLVRRNLRECDHLGRYGGEEFLVIAPGLDESAEKEIYERLCTAAANSEMSTRAGKVPVTISIGVALKSEECTVDSMLAAADAALYQAKNNGRNCVEYAPAAERRMLAPR